MIEIQDPGNETDIQDLYVFMSVDEQGRKGICAAMMGPLGSTPMITGKRSVAKAMQATAQHLTDQSGRSIHLYKFSRDAEPLWRTEQ